MHTKVPRCGSADRVLLLTEEVSVVCAEARAGGEGGKFLHCDHISVNELYLLSQVFFLSLNSGCVRIT